MSQSKGFKKDYYGGTLMTLVGLAAVWAGMQYHTGTLSHMGPGFFPVAVGSLLAFVGILIAVTARGDAPQQAAGHGHGHGHAAPDLRGTVCIVLGTLAFLLFGKYGAVMTGINPVPLPPAALLPYCRKTDAAESRCLAQTSPPCAFHRAQ